MQAADFFDDEELLRKLSSAMAGGAFPNHMDADAGFLQVSKLVNSTWWRHTKGLRMRIFLGFEFGFFRTPFGTL
jgi:hypothetical protein